MSEQITVRLIHNSGHVKDVSIKNPGSQKVLEDMLLSEDGGARFFQLDHIRLQDGLPVYFECVAGGKP